MSYRAPVSDMLALLLSVLLGLVPAADAFKGFSDDIVIIVGSALVLSAAVARSRIIERLFSKLGAGLTSTQLQVPLLVFVVAVMLDQAQYDRAGDIEAIDASPRAA